MIYNSLVLPHLKYCNYIWGNTYKSHLLKLYTFQKKAVRIITKSHIRFPSTPLFKKLQILSIYDLITLNTLIFMYSVQAKTIPDKYCNMFIQKFKYTFLFHPSKSSFSSAKSKINIWIEIIMLHWHKEVEQSSSPH